jgi:hypothetical protein
MHQFDFDAPWPLAEPPAFDLPTDMRALVAARGDLLDEADETTELPPEFVILESAERTVSTAHLALIDNALRIHIGIALAGGYDRDGLAVLSVDEGLLQALDLWDFSQSQAEPPPSP